MQHDHHEFRVRWQLCPHVQHPPQVLFVEAASSDDAKAIAKDHIERTTGRDWFTIYEATLYLRPQGGKVIG